MRSVIADIFNYLNLSQAQKDFFVEFEAGTSPHQSGLPDDHSMAAHTLTMREWQNCAVLCILPNNANPARPHLLLQGIDALTPGQGDGGKALAWVLNLADKHQLAMSLMIVPTGEDNNYLNTRTHLQTWYAKRGFVLVGEDYMRRLPQAQDPIATPESSAPRQPGPAPK